MRRLLRFLLAAILLSHTATAEPLSFRLRTEPQGADVYLLDSAPGGRGLFLGRSNAPILLEQRFLEGRGSVDVRLEKDGYYPLEHNLKVLSLRPGVVLPKDGPLRLHPTDPSNRLLPGALAGLLPAACLAVFLLRRAGVPASASPPSSGAVEKTLDPLVGREVCGFRIERVVTRGGMGILYLAQACASPEKKAAVKVVDLTGYDDTMKQRFFRELTVASRLHHPGVVRTWDYEVLEERYLAIVMEWLPGRDLAACMQNRVLSAREALLVLRPIFEALAYLHERHIIHRDVKPANIFVLPNGMCKLIDFGLARDESRTGLTATGMFLGTPQYVAPEQIVGKGVHPPVDQYALGLVLFFMVTGRPAFQGADAMQVLTQQLGDRPPLASDLNPRVGLDFALGIARMVEKDPSARFAGMMEAYTFLEGVA